MQKKVKIIIASAFLIFCVSFSFRIYFLESKQIAHMDEILSIVLSEYNEYGWTKHFENNKIYTAKELQEAILWNDASILGALRDVGRLWRNNRDDPHTNLYYSLLRLWHIGFTHTDMQHIFYRGVSLNFIFFIGSFILAFALFVRLFGWSYFILPFLALAFLNSASIENTLFMRPYALQEMCFLLFCFVLVKICSRFFALSFNTPLVSKHTDTAKQKHRCKKYIKIWSVCMACVFGICIAISLLGKQERVAQIIVDTNAKEDSLVGKMIFPSVIFRQHKYFLEPQAKLQSMIFDERFVQEKDTFSLSIAENPRYILFTQAPTNATTPHLDAAHLQSPTKSTPLDTLKPTQHIQQDTRLGSMVYTLHTPFVFYILFIIVYILGLVGIVLLPLLSYEVLFLALPTSLLLLSGYFASLFVVMIFALLSLWAYRAKQIKDRLFFITTLYCSLILCTLLYPRYLFAFLGGRGQEVGEKLSFEYFTQSFVDNFLAFWHILVGYLSYSVVIMGICGALFACGYALKNASKILRFLKDTKRAYAHSALSSSFCFSKPFLACLLGLCALIWSFGVIYIAPLKDLRYIMAIFPLLMFMPLYALSNAYTMLRHTANNRMFLWGGGV